jgi:23S rRNA (uridine2552-2'-O)-methyltransferase
MAGKWLAERRRDPYHRLAVEEGYRSRAAYKLLQIVEKYQIIKEGFVVLDLGAAPGGWMQVALSIVGDRGFVLGVDLKPINSLMRPNVASLVADVERLTAEHILEILPRRPDVVLSDLSPKFSGCKTLDHVRQIELARCSLKLARRLLRAGGNFLVKVIQGEFFKAYSDEVHSFFEHMQIIKPKASRKESAETYILGLSLRVSGVNKYMPEKSA